MPGRRPALSRVGARLPFHMTLATRPRPARKNADDSRSSGLEPPELATKKAPTQLRAVETFERILSTCSELLAEVGIERLSTNLICRRAGITPPALYQYFPNKYAILHELGRRMMWRQNEFLTPWATVQTMQLPEAEFAASVAQVFLGTLHVTEDTAGGVWVMRALRAVPSLQHVRMASHEAVTNLVLAAFQDSYPAIDVAQARLTIRLAIDALYAAQELLVDDPQQDPEAVARVMSEMVAAQFVKLRAS